VKAWRSSSGRHREVDQDEDSLFVTFKTIVSLLSKEDKRKYFALSAVGFLLSILDAAAIGLIGIVSALSFRIFQGEESGDRTQSFMKVTQLDSLPINVQIYVLLAAAVVLFILKSVFSFLVVRKTFYFMSRMAAEISVRVLKEILDSPIILLNRISNQEAIQMTSAGTSLLFVGGLAGISTLISDFLMALIVFMVLFAVDPVTALFTCVGFTLVGFISVNLSKKVTQKTWRLYSDLQIYCNNLIAKALESFREIYTRKTSDIFVSDFRKQKEEMISVNASMRMVPLTNKFVLEGFVLIFMFSAVVLQFVLNDPARAAGNAALFAAASTRLGPGLVRIQQGWTSIKGSISGGQLTYDFLKKFVIGMPSRQIESIDNDEMVREDPIVFVHDVTFMYPESSLKFTFKDLTISRNTLVAIVGPSGGGKSTLIDLITGVLTPNSGLILVNGERPRSALSKHGVTIGYVPQRVIMHDDTVVQNILLGLEDNLDNREKIWESLEIVGLKEKIEKLVDGLDSRMGKRGNTFSGGEIQRLGIARALVLNPDILILDESTSSLDSISESKISESYKKLKLTSTIIVVAHRLSTIVDADNIYYVNHGRIEAEGAFDFLVNTVPNFEQQVKALEFNQE